MDSKYSSFKNRYGDVITLRLEDDGCIYMYGGKFFRTIYNANGDAKEITGIDPSGGPFISVGDDLGLFNNQWYGKKVSKIEWATNKTPEEENETIFKLTIT